MDYSEFTPRADKWLHADGSITTMAGDVIEGADARRAEEYENMHPNAAKWLLPDGAVIDALPISGGGNSYYSAVCDTVPATVIKNLTRLPGGYVPSDGDTVLVRFTGGTNTAVACKFTIGSGETEYPILFNGLVTNATASAWKLNSLFPFYFDGEAFNQFSYAKETDSNTTYASIFAQDLTAMRINLAARAVDRYQLVIERADGLFEKALTATYSTAKTKAVNTQADFKVDGIIFYYSTTAALAASARVTASAYFLTQTLQTANIINYALNGADSLTEDSWVYLVGIPQSDPLVYRLDPGGVRSWYTTEKPTSDDGKVYIRLGYYNDGTIFGLRSQHPAYWFKDGAFRPYLTRGAS